MCGIAGFIDFNNQTSEGILKQMTDSLVHRGPDADGCYYGKRYNYAIGLGHRRLSVIDLSPLGNQPMQFGNGRYQIVFNGEVYNYQEIKEELEKKGHRFNSHSDTEVILHAFHEWGTKAVNRFIGMFAFVIYDSQEDMITCFRDRAGVKPFYYYWKDGLFLFGSELKALMAHPRFKRELDLNAVASYMQFGYIPAPHCIYQDTYKLKHGHYLILNLRNQELCTELYWDVYDNYNREKIKIDLPDAINETEKVLEKAFNYRMVADVPVGVFLSGGYDSVCVTSLLQKNSTQKIKTFTIGMTEKKLDEAPFAKKIAEVLGTDHHELYCTEQDALNIVPTLPHFYDEPFGDSSAIPTSLVSKMARESVTVALSADGGDEIFGGYTHYDWMVKYYNRFNSIPNLFRKTGTALLNIFPTDTLPVVRNNNISKSKFEKLKSLMKDPSPKNLFMAATVYYSDEERDKLFSNPVESIVSDHRREELQKEYFDPLSYAMALDYQTYMVDDILHKVDRATMSVSLEGREPFLDQHIIEWAAKLPNQYKINNGQRKYILKQIVHKYVDAKLMDRPKMGFMVPVSTWLQNELKPLVDKYTSREFIEKQGIFDYSYVEDICRKFYNGGKEKHEKIWFLLVFQLWYDKWINNQ
jgi:asparagine synthase (glutamine-hydrolysing)